MKGAGERKNCSQTQGPMSEVVSRQLGMVPVVADHLLF